MLIVKHFSLKISPSLVSTKLFFYLSFMRMIFDLNATKMQIKRSQNQKLQPKLRKVDN